GSATRPVPGISVAVLDEAGNEIEEGTGLLVITEPWPSMLRTLYGEDDRFVETYFSRFGPNTYLVGDSARRDKDGYIWITGRVDDVINVSGHRLSTVEIESALVTHAAVTEAGVVGVHDDLTGQAIVAFVTVRDGVAEAGLAAALQQHVADRIGKIAKPTRIIFTPNLPNTQSGKIIRRLLRDIAEGREPGDTTTLADPTVITTLQQQHTAQ
ncbi:MAG: acetyl-coenzyme A synthetase, partial [Pseudonocardiales bacterium]